MSSIVSRWPISLHAHLDRSDIDNDGRVTVEAAERIFAEACAAYLTESHTLVNATLTSTLTSLRQSEPFAAVPTALTVVIGVTEIFPESLTMAVRLRRIQDSGVVDVRASVTVGGPVTDEVRDECIAREHAAQFTL
jgi:hypothetical protein